MSNATTHPTILDRVQCYALGGVYGLLSFVATAFLFAYSPDQYHQALLFGWIASLFVATQLIRRRYYE